MRFENQLIQTDFGYVVKTSEGPASYESTRFHLTERGGTRVVVPLFPVSEDLNDFVLVSRAVVMVVPRDDQFTIDVLWRIENYTRKTWVPKDITLSMPAGFSAFQAAPGKGWARILM